MEEQAQRNEAPGPVVDDEVVATCPSGLSGSFRGMIGRDYRNLNRQTAKNGEGFTKILNACFTLHDAGIYNVRGNRFDWNEALLGDHTYGLLTIRRAMYPGQKYAFKVTCREPICKSRFGWEIDLAELPVKQMPESTRAQLRNGVNEFEADIRGRKVWFQLLRARDQTKRYKLIQQANRRMEGDVPSDIVFALAARITRAEGVDLGAGDYDDFEEKIRWLEDLPTADHMRMLRAFEKVDCGVETRFDVVCKECGSEQEVDLPLDETFLFMKQR